MFVYIGQTNDPDRRYDEHVRSGKEFTHMKITTYPRSYETSIKEERNDLEVYRNSHQGNNPKYNKTNHG